MKATYKIEVDGKDATRNFSDLESITITDEAGDKSDSLEIVLDDEKAALEIPRKNADIKVSLGLNNLMVEMGTFRLDHSSVSGFPAKMSLFSTASPIKTSFSTSKERSWFENTIGQIISTIAGEHGLKAAIDSELVNVNTRQIDQTNSDMHLLRWLSKKYDAIFKIQSGHLIFVTKGRSVSGFLPKSKVSDNINNNWSFETPPSGEYTGVRAWFLDKNSERKPLTEGSEEKIYEIKFTKKSEEEAREVAKTKLTELSRGSSKLRFSVGYSKNLNPFELTSGQTIEVSGIRKGVDNDWLIKKITHSISADGSFISDLECESLQD